MLLRSSSAIHSMIISKLQDNPLCHQPPVIVSLHFRFSILYFTSSVSDSPYAPTSITGSSLPATENFNHISEGTSSPATASADAPPYLLKRTTSIPQTQTASRVLGTDTTWNPSSPASAPTRPVCSSVARRHSSAIHTSGAGSTGPRSTTSGFQLERRRAVNPVRANPRIMHGCSDRCFYHYHDVPQPESVP